MSARVRRNMHISAKWAVLLTILVGCQSTVARFSPAQRSEPTTSAARRLPPANGPIRAASLVQPVETGPASPGRVLLASASSAGNETNEQPNLDELVGEALSVNPQVRRTEAAAAAAWARVPQLRALPDPMAGGTVFGEPMHMATGQMRGTFMFSQTIPSLKKLDARGQQAAFEALMLRQEAEAARLSVAADVEAAWYRLYLLGQLLRINEANRQLIAPLVEVATGRVEVGETSPGDVVIGTLELSRTEEERLMLEQRLASRKAEMNRLLNRPSNAPVAVPETIDEVPLTQSLEELRGLAFDGQPEIIAARLQTVSTQWGVRVARLERIPDVSVSYEHMFMTPNPGVDASDPWRVGLELNLPLWHRKYRALEREARQENLAARQGVEEEIRQYDTLLLDLFEQARAAEQTAGLYRHTIIPQARQALEVDGRSYSQGMVTFERVISDARSLLMAEAAYYRAIVDRAIAIARIRQAVGGQLPAAVKELELEMPVLLPIPDAE